MSSEVVVIVIVAAMFPTLILVAMAMKWWDIRQASRWPSTRGKVVTNMIESIKNRPGDPGYNFHDTEVTNLPLVEYEYHVGGKQYRGKRITIGEKTSGYEIEEILDRYPVGTEVTVYYDPADPQKAVLERDFPRWVWLVGGGCFLASIAVPLLGIFFYFHGVDWIKPYLAHPDRAPFVTAALAFGLLVLLFAFAFTRYVRQASHWPVVRGKIVATGVEAYREWRDVGYQKRYRYYKSNVIYTYEVHGRKYAGDRIRLGVVTSATSPRSGKRLAAKYPVGKEVDVHYDPKRPGDSVLQPRTLWFLLPWLVAIGMLTLAWWAGMK